MRIISLVLLSSALSFAGTWSGTLVDAECWGYLRHKHTTPNVERNQSLEVRQCSPKAKTKSFAVLTPEGTALGLDAAGHARAELAEAAHGKAPIKVVVTGEQHTKKSIQVSSISAAK
jgi:hypothetical protein